MRSFRTAVSVVAVSIVALLVLAGCGGNGGTGNDMVDNPPTPPSGLNATDQVGGVTLQWDEVDAADLDGYNVYRDTVSFNSIANRSSRNDAPVSDPTFRDDDVENGTLYYYRVSAVDDAGNEGNPSDQVAVTVFPSPPDRP